MLFDGKIQDSEHLDTVISMAHEFGQNLGYWPQRSDGDVDTRIRHNETVIMRLERHIDMLAASARQRGDVSAYVIHVAVVRTEVKRLHSI